MRLDDGADAAVGQRVVRAVGKRRPIIMWGNRQLNRQPIIRLRQPSLELRVQDRRLPHSVLASVTHTPILPRQTAIGRSLSVLILMLMLLPEGLEPIRVGNYEISIGFSNSMGQVPIPWTSDFCQVIEHTVRQSLHTKMPRKRRDIMENSLQPKG